MNIFIVLLIKQIFSSELNVRADSQTHIDSIYSEILKEFIDEEFEFNPLLNVDDILMNFGEQDLHTRVDEIEDLLDLLSSYIIEERT